MKDLQYKSIKDSTLDVDDKSRYVKVAISEVGSLDYDQEVIDPGAFTKTISERGPGAANLIWHLTDHKASLQAAVGKFNELGMEGNKLVGGTPILKTNWGNDMLEMYKSGVINQHSIGFVSQRSEWMNENSDNEYRLIKEVKLYEGSAVLWGANANTPTVSVGKCETPEEQKAEVDLLIGEMEILEKSLRKSNFTDETAELIEYRIVQIKQRVHDLFGKLTHVEAKISPVPSNDKNGLGSKLLLLTTI